MSAIQVQRIKLLIGGALLLALAAAIPMYLRAVDTLVVKEAGVGSKSLAAEAENQLRLERPGITELLIAGGKQCGIPDLYKVASAHRTFQLENPDLNFWGGAFPDLESVSIASPYPRATVLEALVSKETRQSILARLENSRRPGVQALLQNRRLTHTEVFPPVNSAGGAALDGVIVAIALLSQGDYLTPEFRAELERRAAEANRGRRTHGIESLYLDVLALTKQMNWAQFSGLMSRLESREALRRLAHTLATHPDDLPRLFAICWMSPSTEAVTQYLSRYPESGLDDLAYGITTHSGGLEAILQRQERLFRSTIREAIDPIVQVPAFWSTLAMLSVQFPWTALLFKYLAVLMGAFCWIRLVFSLWPEPRLIPEQFRVEGTAVLRQQILALCVLGLFVLLGEPFLAQNSQRDETPVNWRFPTAPAAVVEKVDTMLGEKIDELTLLALVLFFLVQAVLYALCLVKLKEIQKQKGSSRLKLKLLDNEDNMFDAGLYVGLGGTVLSLLILTLNLAQVGLMAAYASTLFGIIFVSLLKIIHVRPLRRKFLIEAEAGIL